MYKGRLHARKVEQKCWGPQITITAESEQGVMMATYKQ